MSKSEVVTPAKYTLKIGGTRKLLNWMILDTKTGDPIKRGIDRGSDFMVENLAIINGANGQSIFVSNQPSEFNRYSTPEIWLSRIVCKQSEREYLEKMLKKGDCCLEIAIS